MGEDVLESFLEAVNVVVDQVLAVDFTLIDQADQSQTLVHLSQVKHDVFLVVCVRQLDDRRRLLVKLRAVFLIIAINAGHVNEDVDELGADFVMLHIHGGRIRRNVHLRDNVEEECFLNLAARDQRVHHLRNESHLGEQLLHNLGKSHVDGVVVDGSQLESQRDGLTEFLEQAAHVRLDSVQALDFLVVVHKHIAVNFVNENFVPDVWLHLVSLSDHLIKLLTSAIVVSVVSVDHVNESSTVGDLLVGVGLEHEISWEVDDIELDVVVVAHGLHLDIARRQQEKGLVRAHLLKDYFGNGCFARSTQEQGQH